MKVVLRDTLTTYWRGRVQYDRGQYLEIYNSGVYENNVKFQFIHDSVQHHVLGELINNEYCKVRIPDDFLKIESEISCFLYLETEESAETKKILILDVIGREWYAAEPTEEEISIMGQILDKLNDMQNQIDNFTITDEQLQKILDDVMVLADKKIDEALSKIDFSKYVTTDEFNALQESIGRSFSSMSQTIDNQNNKFSEVNQQIMNLTEIVNTLKSEVEAANAVLETI